MARNTAPPRSPPRSSPPVPAAPQAHGGLREIARNLSIVDLLVFLASEGIGVPLALAGGEAAANELLRPAIIGFGFGLPLMALGFAFPFVKHRLSDEARDKILGIAAFLTTVLVLSAFVYVVGPAIYQQVAPHPPANPPSSPPISTTPPPSAIAPVRIDIMGANFLPRKPGDNLQMNFYYANRSPTLPALGVVEDGKMIISPHVLSAEEEAAVTMLYFAKDDFPGPNIASEYPPGSMAGWYTVNSDIDDEHLKNVVDGKSFLYVFTYLKYGDPDSGLMTETEWCAYYNANLNVAHQCLTFTRVHSIASKRRYLP